MTWHIVDAAGRRIAAFASRVSGEVGALSTTTLYAGVVDYEAGAVVGWNLAWAESSSGGIVPTLLTEGVPDGRIGVVFTDPDTGGARGVATLTATVHGGAAAAGLTATVEAGFAFGWLDPYDDMNGVAVWAGEEYDLDGEYIFAGDILGPLVFEDDTLTIYAGIPDYASGELTALLAGYDFFGGIAPELVTEGVPAGKIGVRLTNPAIGGAAGVRLILMLDGDPSPISTTIAAFAGPSAGWFRSITDPDSLANWYQHTDAITSVDPVTATYYAGVIGDVGAVVVWSMEDWTPYTGGPAPALTPLAGGVVSIVLNAAMPDFPSGVASIKATVDGLPTNTLVIEFGGMDPDEAGNIAFGPGFWP